MTLGDLLLKVGVTGLPQFQAEMAGFGGTVNKVFGDVDKQFRGLDKASDAAKNLGASITGLAAPFIGAGAAALTFAGDFDGAMREVTSLTGNAHGEFQALSDQTLELAESMGVDATDSAHALYEALSANIPEENVMSFLETATATGIAGITSTETAVNALTTVLNSYGLEASEAKNISDAMFTAVNFGKVTFEELASSVGIAASGAKAMGVSYDDLLATMAAITLQGRTSSEAFTEIQAAMKALQSPNKEMNELLAKTGYASGEALVQAKGFAGALQDLNKAAGGNSAVLNDAFGRLEAYNAMLHVTGPGADLVAEATQRMNEKFGATAAAQEEIEQGAPRAWARLKAEMQVVSIEAGQALLPAFKAIAEVLPSLIGHVSSAVQWFKDLPDPIQNTVLAIAGVTAVAGPAIYGVGALAGAFVDIAKGVSQARDLMEKFPAVANAVTTAFKGLGVAIVYAGTAYAGFRLGEYLYQQIPFVQRFADSIAGVLLKFEAFQKLAIWMRGDLPEQTEVIKRLEGQFKELGVSVQRGNETAEQYINRLYALRNEVTKNGDAATIAALKAKAGTQATQENSAAADAARRYQEDLAKALGGTATAHGAAAKATEDHKQKVFDQNGVLREAESRLREVEQANRMGLATDEQVAEAKDYVKRILVQMHPEWQRTAEEVKLVTGALDQMADLGPIIASGLQNIGQITQDMIQLPDFTGVTEETKDALDDQVDAHTQAGKKVENVWTRTTQQVSTIISDLGKNFAGGILKLFDNSENDRISQQIGDLQGELAKATAEYQKHVADVTAELDGIPAAYAAAIDSIDADTAKKLGLIDKDYKKSIDGIKKRFDDVTKAAAKELDEQLKDLDDQLADRKKSYERSVEDAQENYDDDTRNLKDSLADKELDYKHWVEQQQLALKRLEGDNSESAQRQREDIQLALQQRAEDMELTRSQINAKLLDEEQDLKTSLARKKADWDAEQAEILERQQTAKDNYKLKLDEAEADLKSSVADRKEEWETDKANAIAAANAAKEEVAKKYGEQTAALQAELDKSKAAYDTYKTDVTTKLTELHDAMKTPLDKIGDLFKGIFTTAGEALLRFAGEEVFGVLLGQVDKLLGKIPGLSGLGGIFGGGGGGTQNGNNLPLGLPGAGSGGGSSAGSAVGGLVGALNPISMVANIIGAGAQVLSMFGVGVQGSINDHLKEIRNDTWYIAWALGEGGGLEALSTLKNDIHAFVEAQATTGHDAWVELLDGVGAIKEYTALSLQSISGGISDNLAAIRAACEVNLPELAAIRTAMTTQQPSISVVIQGNVIGNEDFVDYLEQALSQRMQLQGA